MHATIPSILDRHPDQVIQDKTIDTRDVMQANRMIELSMLIGDVLAHPKIPGSSDFDDGETETLMGGE
ncbi:MAG: hypothetical protein HRU78_02620 [Gammaproteobacteria bacterium]|nr:MAG: hypothetical protein HRU78_02620 [Gammaproteobacteria bacterium]